MSEADNAAWEAKLQGAGNSSGRLLGMKQEVFEIISFHSDPISTGDLQATLRTRGRQFTTGEVEAAAFSLVAEKEVKWSEPQGKGFRFSSTNRRIGTPWSEK